MMPSMISVKKGLPTSKASTPTERVSTRMSACAWALGT